jgi:hypothetical protein
MLKISKSLTLLFLISASAWCKAQIKLEQRNLLNDKIVLAVPDFFKPMSATMTAIKYPNPGQQPNLILTDENAEVNIVITLTPQPLNQAQVGQYKDFMVNSLKKMHPDAEFLDNGVKTINGRKVGYFKLISQAVDQKVFVFYFFTDLGGKAMVLTFNCTQVLLPKWKDTADEIMNSLKVK